MSKHARVALEWIYEIDAPSEIKKKTTFHGVKLMIVDCRLKTDGKAENSGSGRKAQGVRCKELSEHSRLKAESSTSNQQGDAL